MGLVKTEDQKAEVIEEKPIEKIKTVEEMIKEQEEQAK